MVKTGIIIGLGALVGWLIINGVMLIKYMTRMHRGKFVVWELFAVFLTGGMSKDYMKFLKDSQLIPSRLDKMLCILDRTFASLFAGGIVLVAIGFIWR
jgi:hypothetical protein